MLTKGEFSDKQNETVLKIIDCYIFFADLAVLVSADIYVLFQIPKKTKKNIKNLNIIWILRERLYPVFACIHSALFQCKTYSFDSVIVVILLFIIRMSQLLLSK
jgi:hypothetical protein